MVFVGTVRGKVFGLKFIRGLMTAADYHSHVIDTCIPEIEAINGGIGIIKTKKLCG
jgi:hypothetical protein